MSEDGYIKNLLNLDRNFNDTLDYDLFPENSGNRKWWKADDGYNSNSYTSGLLNAAGTPMTAPPSTPGFQKPVSIGNFKKP